MGLAAANYFAATDNEGKAIATATATPHPLELSKIPKDHGLPTVLNAPIKSATNLEPLPKDSVGINNTLTEDISLLETVDANRQEWATTEPSPEELAKNQPMDLVATPPLSREEADDLDKLRLESEGAAPIPLEGNDGLLEHEKL